MNDPRSLSRGAPAVVTRLAADYPIGGGTTKIDATPAPQPLANLRQRDGVPRAATIFLSAGARSAAGNDNVAAACRITVGGGRGQARWWSGVPRVIPVVGSYVLVEGMLTQTPYTFGPAGPTTFATAGDPGMTITAEIVEGWSADLPDTLLATRVLPINLAVATVDPIIVGPVLVTAIKFANKGASDVQLLIGDKNGGNVLVIPIVETFLSPAGTTTSLELDQPFFRGVSIWAVSDFTAGPPFGGYDANGANVEISIYGLYLGGL